MHDGKVSFGTGETNVNVKLKPINSRQFGRRKKKKERKFQRWIVQPKAKKAKKKTKMERGNSQIFIYSIIIGFCFERVDLTHGGHTHDPGQSFAIGSPISSKQLPKLNTWIFFFQLLQ